MVDGGEAREEVVALNLTCSPFVAVDYMQDQGQNISTLALWQMWPLSQRAQSNHQGPEKFFRLLLCN